MIRSRRCRVGVLAVCATVALAAEAAAQGRGSVPAGSPALRPASWLNRTRMLTGQASPSRFYAVRSDLAEAETIEFARRLDLMYAEYQKRLAGLEQRAPGHLTVYMFARKQDYIDTLRSEFGADASGSAGMFFVTPRGSGLAFFTEGVPRSQIFSTVQHEGFHQVAFTRFGTDLPPWVDEGLAEFFGQALVLGNEVVIGQSNARTIRSLKQAIESGTTIPFLEMVTMTPAAWSRRVQGGDAGLQYQQAWSMVHFLVYGESGRFRPAFERYLRLLNNGSNSVDAFQRAFGTTDLTEFERRWKSFAMSAVPGATITAAERLRFLAEGMLALNTEGVRPKDLDELRRLLVERRFAIQFEQHGRAVRLSAEDPGNFEIPADEHAKTPPVFELVPFRLRGSTAKERRLEEAHPTPDGLATSGLRPRELQVRWRRTDEEGGFQYEIVAK